MDGTPPQAAKACSWQARKFHEHLAAERQHHDEERKPAAGIAHRDGSIGTPIDLRTLAGSKVQLEIDRPLGRSDAARRHRLRVEAQRACGLRDRQAPQLALRENVLAQS